MIFVPKRIVDFCMQKFNNPWYVGQKIMKYEKALRGEVEL